MNVLSRIVTGRSTALRRPEAASALTRVATALAVVSVGALSLGAVAVGALAIGALAVKRARIQRLEIGELLVGGQPFPARG